MLYATPVICPLIGARGTVYGEGSGLESVRSITTGTSGDSISTPRSVSGSKYRTPEPMAEI